MKTRKIRLMPELFDAHRGPHADGSGISRGRWHRGWIACAGRHKNRRGTRFGETGARDFREALAVEPRAPTRLW